MPMAANPQRQIWSRAVLRCNATKNADRLTPEDEKRILGIIAERNAQKGIAADMVMRIPADQVREGKSHRIGRTRGRLKQE